VVPEILVLREVVEAILQLVMLEVAVEVAMEVAVEVAVEVAMDVDIVVVMMKLKFVEPALRSHIHSRSYHSCQDSLLVRT
jgi:hypothetical protein